MICRGPTKRSMNKHAQRLTQEQISKCFELTSNANYSAKEAARCLKKRLQMKELKVVALSLELLDQCMLKCGQPFHIQIGQKDFLNVIIVMLNTPGIPPPVRTT